MNREKATSPQQITQRKITFAGQSLAQYKKNNIATKDTKILIGLSIVGNPHCVGEDLFAIAEHAINNHKEVFFLIGDEIHWHNLKSGSDTTQEEILDLKKQAIALGTNYLNKNLSVFLNLVMKKNPTFDIDLFNTAYLSIDEKIDAINAFGLFTIIRWHDWVSNNEYVKNQTEIMACYETHPTLKADLEISANEFIKRHPDKCRFKTIDYMKEETPALFWIPAALQIDFVAYPGKIIKVFESTQDIFIADKNSVAPHPLSIGATNDRKMANWLQISVKIKHKEYSFFSKNHQNRSIGTSNIRRAHSDGNVDLGSWPLNINWAQRKNLTERNSRKEDLSTSPDEVASIWTESQKIPAHRKAQFMLAVNKLLAEYRDGSSTPTLPDEPSTLTLS